MGLRTKTETIEVCFELRYQTDMAYLLFDGVHKVWIPKNQVVKMRHISGSDYELSIPYWLAKKKGIVKHRINQKAANAKVVFLPKTHSAIHLRKERVYEPRTENPAFANLADFFRRDLSPQKGLPIPAVRRVDAAGGTLGRRSRGFTTQSASARAPKR